MTRFLLALTLTAALTTSASASAAHGIFPSPPWVDGGFVAAFIDTHPGPTLHGHDTLQGWASVCAQGASLTRVTATALVRGVPMSIPMDFGIGGSRPDVDAHLQAHGCAGNPTSGFAAAFPGGLPDGTTRVSIQFWHHDIHAWFVYQVQ